MKKLVGAMTLIATILAMAPPPGIFAQSAGDETKTYSARKVRRDLGEKGQIVIESLELNEADIGDVVRLLARLAGINIITGDIRGSITVYLENVTVQDAMEAILASQGYGFLFDGNIVRVVEASRLGEDRVETITETFLLNYLPAEEVANTLKNVFKGGDSLGGGHSQIEANIEANAVIVVDIPRKMEDIRRLIYILDRRFEQVEIEGRFIELSYSQDQEWGIDWQYFQDPANSLDVNLSPQPLDAQNVAGQFKFAVINGSHNLNGFIQALETDNDIRILANPKILALENQPALIELTDEIPFVEANISQGVITESVQFQETGIRLQVTPSIAHESDGTYVRMTLDLEQRIPGPNVVLQNSIAFPIDSRHAQTDLIVPDDATVIIGGLKSNDLNYTYEKIPFLGSVPFLGAPFRRRAKTDDQTELILFVTPRVIYENPPLDMKEQELHDKVDSVIDSLETQAEWRERAEAPVDMVDKAIMYSGVECNDERYDRVMDMKNTIEGVKPYKVSKPKGIRKVRIDSTGEYIEEQEFVDESQEGTPSEPIEGNARDFSVIQEKAGRGTGDSGVKFYGEGEEGEEGDTTYQAPLPPTEPESAPESAPEAAPEAAPESGDRERPSWLRRGTRSDAGDVIEKDKVLEDLPDEDEVVEIEILPEPFEGNGQTESAGREQLDLPPVDGEDESVSLDQDPWGLPSESKLELPPMNPIESVLENDPSETVEVTSAQIEPMVETVPQPERVVETAVQQEPIVDTVALREPVEETPSQTVAVGELPVPAQPVAAAKSSPPAVHPPVSESPQRVESPDDPVEVEAKDSDLLALPSGSPIVAKPEPESPAKIAGAPITGALVPTQPSAPAKKEPVAPPEVVNLIGLVPAPVPRPIEKKVETVKAAQPEVQPVAPPQAPKEESHPKEASVAVVDLRGETVKQKPTPDLRSLLDPSILDALKEMERTETGATATTTGEALPAGSAVDPWSPLTESGSGIAPSGLETSKSTPAEQTSDESQLIAHNLSDEPLATPSETQTKDRSWWKRILGRE